MSQIGTSESSDNDGEEEEEEERKNKILKLSTDEIENTVKNDDMKLKRRSINKKHRVKKGVNDSPGPSSYKLPDILQKMEKELELELETKAEKNNLSAWNVKNMIKAVVTDCEVLKMVEYSTEKESEKPEFEVELKLTRAKTKELGCLGQTPVYTLPSLPIKKSDIDVLIREDLSEDSSDEEYEPQYDTVHTDDESKTSENFLEDDIVCDDDCTDLNTSHKSIPSQADTVTEADAENIGQRTRSKLSLSETPLEAIELAFIPPDITTDMYNTDCDNDDWLNFLKEFQQPLEPTQPETVDDDNDPEYNAMIDDEPEGTDKEELREDRAVKVTKKELNDLMAELAEYTDMLSSDDEDLSTKVDSIHADADFSMKADNIDADEDLNTKADNVDADESSTTPVKEIKEEKLPDGMTSSQFLLLQQQLQQHVQLVLQTYLLTFGNPAMEEYCVSECRQRLIELDNFRKMKSSSAFNVLNLQSSIKLIDDWTATLLNPANYKRIKKFTQEELEKVKLNKLTKVRYHPQLPEELIKICLMSDAFLYPLLLPEWGYSDFEFDLRSRFSTYEDQLLAMGLEQFSEFLGCDVNNRQDFNEVVSYIQEYLLPPKTEEQIITHVKSMLKSSNTNPIKEFFLKKKAPEVKHFVVIHSSLKLLKDYPHSYFPESWMKYLSRD